MPKTRPILITGGRLVTMADGAPDEQVGSLLVIGGKIAEIIAPGAIVADAEIIDASGMIVLPGFVDTHRHVWQTQLRTLAADWSLFDYLVRMRSIYSAFYTPDDAYLGNHLGALEAVNAGVTTFADHSHMVNSPAHANSLINGLDHAGIRAVFCYGFFVNPSPDGPPAPSPGWRYEDIRRIRRERLTSADGRILLGVSPQEPEATAPDVFHDEIRLCRDIGAHSISMHVAMGNYDGQNRVVTKLVDAGLIGPDMLFVHGAALTDDELQAIMNSGAGLSSTPETELQMGMGFPVAFSARSKGVRTSLGIDIVSNYAGDMFAQMRLALQTARGLDNQELAQRIKAPRHIRVKTRDALRLATLGGAEALHLEHRIGTLEKGKAADIIMIRSDGIHMSPSPDPIAATVLGATVGDVDTVMIDGVVRKRGGVLVGVDLPGLNARLTVSSERIRAGLGYVDIGNIEKIWSGIFPHLE